MILGITWPSSQVMELWLGAGPCTRQPAPQLPSDKERKGVLAPAFGELEGGNSRDFGRGNVRGLKVHEGEKLEGP